MKEKIKYEFPLLKNDSVIKYLFKNKETRYWFLEIILWLLNLDLKEYEIFDNELNSGNNRKDYHADLILKKENTFIIIEMNTSNKKLSNIKDYQYLFRVAGYFYEKGETYYEKYAKLIRFNDFIDGNKNLRHFRFKDDVNKVIEWIESYEIYLPKYKKKNYNKASELERRLMMLSADNENDIKKYAYSEKDKMIIKELEDLQMNDELMGFFCDPDKIQRKWENSLKAEAREEGLKEGLKEGLAEGIIEGREENMKMLITNMLNENDMTIEKIAKIANVGVEKVKAIKKEIDSKIK